MIRKTRHLEIDKDGLAFELGPAGEGDGPALKNMYDRFSPKAVAQGLPPEGDEQRRVWVEGLLNDAENLLARQGDRVVGHCALIPDHGRGDAEYIIFVDKQYRNKGLGTVLTGDILELAKALGLKLIWLCVAVTNFPAVRLYQKSGFRFVDHDCIDRTMHLRME